jgi:hypothetical protein
VKNWDIIEAVHPVVCVVLRLLRACTTLIPKKKMASGKSNMWSQTGIIYNLSTAADLLTLSIMCIMMFYSVCVSVYYVLFYFFLFFYFFRDHLPVRD